MSKEKEEQIQKLKFNNYINLNPRVVLKKIKLRRSDAFDNQIDALPELVDDENVDEDSHDKSLKLGEDKKVSNVLEDLTTIHTMTNDELNEHIQKCMEMSSENKITPKNAFALQLIDCMSLLLKKKDFSAMACTLDAGAKIYSYRVDALHQQVTKLAIDVIQHRTNGKSVEKEIETGKKIEHVKRRPNKRNVIAAPESLRRKLRGKDPKDRFIRLDARPGAIVSAVRIDDNDLSYTLENNLRFREKWDDYKPLIAEGFVTLPKCKIVRNEEIQPDMSNNDFKTESQSTFIIMATNGNSISNKMLLPPVKDYTISDLNNDDSFEDPVDDGFDDDEKSIEEEVGVISTAMKRLNEEAESNGAKALTRFETMKIVFNEASEYNYLDMRHVKYWAGPEYWKRSRPLFKDGKRKNKSIKQKKEPSEISYESFTDEKWNKLFRRGTNLKNKIVSNWKNNKQTLPRLETETNIFLDLFHITIESELVNNADSQDSSGFPDSIEFENNVWQESNGDSSNNVNSQDEINSSNSQDPLNASFYDGVPGPSPSSDNNNSPNSAFYDAGLIRQRTESGKVIKVEIDTSNPQRFSENFLVPAPKIVKFNPIKYSTKPIRVDMQHLKQSMMGLIEEEIEHNTWRKKTDPCAPVIPATRFSEVLKRLPTRLEKRTAEDLSPAIAFMCLLTLANENNLSLKNTVGYTDVVIKLEDNSSVFINREN